MKTKLLHLLPVFAVLLLALGCTKTTDDSSEAAVLPVGNYTGQFLHIRQTSKGLDTDKANLQLSLSQSTGFAITGDTSTLHAGSYGAYGVNAYYIQFVDKTYSATQPFAKYHLQGLYYYTYNGSQLVFYVTYGDTVELKYNFTKVTN